MHEPLIAARSSEAPPADLEVAADQPRPSEAERLLASGRGILLSASAQLVLETLVRFGALGIRTSNGAAQIDHHGPVRKLVVEGPVASLEVGEGTAFWVFPEQVKAIMAVNEPSRIRAAVSLRFFGAAGQSLLELHAGLSGETIFRVRRCVERWQAGRFFVPPRFQRPPAPSPDRPVPTSPGLGVALGIARNGGEQRAVHELSTRHGLSRLEALSLVGPPWARRLEGRGLARALGAVSARGMRVRLLAGNEAATYARSGSLARLQGSGSALTLRDRNTTLNVDLGALHSLWAVSLREGDREVSSLEAFDAQGAPALLVFGHPEHRPRPGDPWNDLCERQTVLPEESES